MAHGTDSGTGVLGGQYTLTPARVRYGAAPEFNAPPARGKDTDVAFAHCRVAAAPSPRPVQPASEHDLRFGIARLGNGGATGLPYPARANRAGGPRGASLRRACAPAVAMGAAAPAIAALLIWRPGWLVALGVGVLGCGVVVLVLMLAVYAFALLARPSAPGGPASGSPT